MAEPKKILITGCSGGIGLEVACRYASRGYHVIAVERTAELAAQAAQVIGVDCTQVTCDLADAADVTSLCGRIEDDWTTLDICFLNAGIILPGNAITTPAELIDRHIDIMLRSSAKLARSAAIAFAGRGAGHVVATVSQGAIVPLPGSAAYSAAKAGLRAYLGALHLEVRDAGVGVGGVYPSAVDTAMLYHEATHGGSVLNFVGTISSVTDVADGVDRLIGRGNVEEYVPRADGYSSRLLQSCPRLTRAILPIANRIGERGRRRYLAARTA